MANSRPVHEGARVRVNGGPYDERVGHVLMLRGKDDLLFENGARPIHGLLSEDMALVHFDGTDPLQVGVPIRRLEVL